MDVGHFEGGGAQRADIGMVLGFELGLEGEGVQKEEGQECQQDFQEWITLDFFLSGVRRSERGRTKKEKTIKKYKFIR
jgi:hypothetical protein